MEGWVKLHRKSMDHWLYNTKKPKTRREAWEDMIMLVNYEDSKSMIRGQIYECSRGQSLRSLDSWAKQFNWSKQMVRTFFELLKTEQMITIEGLQYTTRLTICNYDMYQQVETHEKHTKQHADNTPITPIKERKENKKEIYIPEFDEFKNYALENDPLIDVFSLEIKYKAWKENGWKNGKEKEIKNWKSALLNTLPYIKHNTSPLPQPQQTYHKRGLVENPNFDPR